MNAQQPPLSDAAREALAGLADIATPELADHVTKAQASGLPSRLTRTEDQTVIDSNRTKACGSAPSVPGKSCDEP